MPLKEGLNVTRDEIIMQVSEKLRLIRTEAGYTQDKMAEIIGVSKKTLVQIEKGRVLANWSTAVSICALFRETETVQFLFGNEPLEVLETVAREGIDIRKSKTFGGQDLVESSFKEKWIIFFNKIFLVNIFASWMREITESLAVLMRSFQDNALKN